MSGGVLALFSVCLGVTILELALPGEEREGAKRFLRFFASLVVLLLILRPVHSLSGAEGGCIGVDAEEADRAAYEQMLQEAVSRRSAEQLRRGLVFALEKEFGLAEVQYELSIALDDGGELAGLALRLKGGGLMRDPYEIEAWLAERFECEVSVR